MLQGLINWLASGKSKFQIAGSAVDLRGLSTEKPDPDAVEIWSTYWSVDTDPHAESIEVSNGTSWAVI